MDGKTSDWRPGPSVCRCCLAEGCYKDISTEYFWMGKREVYAEMLSDTFSVSIAYSSAGGPNSHSRLICEPCISRLRDAADFKRQVQECERTFMQHLDPGGTSAVNDVDIELEPIGKEVKLEQVKLEKRFSDDDFDNIGFGDDDDDDMDDQPLTKFASKVPKKETVDFMDLIDNSQVTVKRMSTSKSKAPPSKKIKVTKKSPSKPAASKPPIKVVKEKKKKGQDVECNLIQTNTVLMHDQDIKKRNDDIKARKRHATILLESSRICPFRWMKNLYICFYCEQNYSDPSRLREHNLLEHNSLKGLQIKHALSKLKKYELIKVDVTNIDCKICNESIEDLNSLKIHLVDKHKKSIDLNVSDGVLPFKVTLADFRCAICKEKYDEFKTLNHHMNVHFQNFICEQCGTGFITPERLRTHAFSHETGSFPCDGCDKAFRSTNAKNEHYATVHLKVKRHRCPHCTETFRNYFQRNKHISSIHGLKLKEFKCTMCPKVFNLSGKLGVHVRTVHLKMKRHACDVCDWKFYSKSELKDHMIRHGGERKYQCSVCKKSYARKYTLREHMRIHDNDRRFVCTVCGRSFVQNCSLKHHTKIHHPQLGPEMKTYT